MRILLRAFAITGDKTDTLSLPLLSKFLDPPLILTSYDITARLLLNLRDAAAHWGHL